VLYGPLSLAAMINPVILNYSNFSDGGFAVELPLYLGPRYAFMGAKNDLYFSLLGQFRSVTPVTLTDDELGESKEFGPFWITGMSVDTGFKFYLYNRMSAAPLFINFGMLLGVLQYRFELDFSDPENVPLEMWLYLGFGSRL